MDNFCYLEIEVDGWSEKEVRIFVKSFELWNSKSIDVAIKIIFDPKYRTSEYAYQVGKQLIANKFGEYPSPKDFRYLLEKPLLPSDLV